MCFRITCMTFTQCVVGSDFLIHISDPEIPGPMTVIQSKYTMRLRFRITSGNVDYYRVLSTSVCTSPTFVNVSYEVEKSSESKNIKLITEPGACCSLNVAAVSNNVSGKVQTYAVKRRETGKYANSAIHVQDNYIVYNN